MTNLLINILLILAILTFVFVVFLIMTVSLADTETWQAIDKKIAKRIRGEEREASDDRTNGQV